MMQRCAFRRMQNHVIMPMMSNAQRCQRLALPLQRRRQHGQINITTTTTSVVVSLPGISWLGPSTSRFYSVCVTRHLPRNSRRDHHVLASSAAAADASITTPPMTSTTKATLRLRHRQPSPLATATTTTSLLLPSSSLLTFVTKSTPPAATPPPLVNKTGNEETRKDGASTTIAQTTTPDKATTATTTTSDPSIWTWVDRYLPTKWQPYARLARLDKPIGTWLLLWPCCWSTALAHPVSALDHFTLVTLFGVGALTMRGAGCTINDLCDQDIDQAVARTRARPLAAGDLNNTQALQFLALQLATGCAVLVSLPHTWYCFQWGVASLPLVFLYPTTKRYFAYPQLVLGLCFNWGAWMGWAATYGSMEWTTVAPLYLSGVTWTLVYDTIYAHQDKEDDSKLGLHSTALSFGSDENTQRQILHGLAATTFLLWATAGYQADMVNPGLFGAGITAAYAHLVWQIQTADMQNAHNLASRFRSNSTTGALVYGALLAGHPPIML